MSGKRVDAARNRKRVLAGRGARARPPRLGARHAGRRAQGGRRHRHGLSPLPLAAGADRGDRLPVLRARARTRALGGTRVSRGRALRRLRARIRGCARRPRRPRPVHAGMRRRRSRCGPSCGRSSASSSRRASAAARCAATSPRRTRSRCCGRSPRSSRPRTRRRPRSGSATSSCCSTRSPPARPATCRLAPVDRAQWDRFVRSTRVTVEHREPTDPEPGRREHRPRDARAPDRLRRGRDRGAAR